MATVHFLCGAFETLIEMIERLKRWPPNFCVIEVESLRRVLEVTRVGIWEIHLREEKAELKSFDRREWRVEARDERVCN